MINVAISIQPFLNVEKNVACLLGGFTITFVHKMRFKNWDLHVRYCKIDMKTSVNQIKP